MQDNGWDQIHGASPFRAAALLSKASALATAAAGAPGELMSLWWPSCQYNMLAWAAILTVVAMLLLLLRQMLLKHVQVFPLPCGIQHMGLDTSFDFR